MNAILICPKIPKKNIIMAKKSKLKKCLINILNICKITKKDKNILNCQNKIK
jgi:hypothetical protein